MITMREVFGQTLAEIGAHNSKLVVLDADVSSSTKTSLFQKKFPERFFNFGIAEANMVSAAAGFASCGFIPVVSTFAFLLAHRSGDQVRSQIAHSMLNVKLAGGYAGLSDFADGSSHQSVDDIAVMRALPNMTVLSPADEVETRKAVMAAVEYKGPVYIRLSRAEVGQLLDKKAEFRIGSAVTLRSGTDVTLAVTGTMLAQALEACDLLKHDGISAEVLHFPTIKPLDGPALLQSLRKTGTCVTIEEHSVVCGFGSAVAEFLSQNEPFPVAMIGLQDTFGESGNLQALYEKYGLSPGHIASMAKTKGLNRKKRGAP